MVDDVIRLTLDRSIFAGKEPREPRHGVVERVYSLIADQRAGSIRGLEEEVREARGCADQGPNSIRDAAHRIANLGALIEQLNLHRAVLILRDGKVPLSVVRSAFYESVVRRGCLGTAWLQSWKL